MTSRERSPLSSSSSSASTSSRDARQRHRLRGKRPRLSLPNCVLGLFSDAQLSGPAAVADAVVVKVHVVEDLNIRVLEASVLRQEQLVEQAVQAPHHHANADPYGVALWPSGQVLAQAVVAYAKMLPNASSLLELGAGCGPASLIAAKLGMRVLATDFRSLPLEFLAKSARLQSLSLSTDVFDICDSSSPLPPGDIVVASDLMYDSRAAKALAQRTFEARKRGSIVLLGDVGRSGRDVFLAELQRLSPETVAGFDCQGLAVQSVSGDECGLRREVLVDILELPCDGPAKAQVNIGSPCIAVRPVDVGVVSLVESTCLPNYPHRSCGNVNTLTRWK